MKHTFLSNLEWRFATKKFDPDKEVSRGDLEKILQAIRFAPASRGLQPYHVIVIQDDQLKRELYPLAKNQTQIIDCRYLLVFCFRLDLRERLESYMELQEKHDPSLRDTHEAMASKLNNFADNKEAEGLESWALRQTYIALGFGLAACAELRIDSCPMEGFQKDEADKALKLPPYLKSTALLAIGYRQDGPARPKFRFPASDLFSFR